MYDNGEELTEIVEEEEEKKKFSLRDLFINTAAVSYLVGDTIYKGGKAAVNGVTKTVKGAKDMAEEYGPDVKRGYQIGSDVGGLVEHMDPVGTVKDVFKGNEPVPKDVTEDSPKGVKSAEEYNQRLDSVSEDQHGPVNVATWGIGFWPGLLTYIITWPFKGIYNLINNSVKKAKERKASKLEEMIDEE